jgi:hypothetical protein
VSAELGRKTRADTGGSDEMMTSFDRTPVIGSSEGGIFSVMGWRSTTRPSLYTSKKRNLWGISESLEAIEKKQSSWLLWAERVRVSKVCFNFDCVSGEV